MGSFTGETTIQINQRASPAKRDAMKKRELLRETSWAQQLQQQKGA